MTRTHPEAAAWKRGYVHVYTGDGKGKTTAAFGLALRAVGAGLAVFVAQFAKGRPSGERDALARLGPLVTLRHYGGPNFIIGAPTPEDLAEARCGLADATSALLDGHHRLVILDEATTAVSAGLFPIDALLALMAKKPLNVELVITGRNAHPAVIAAADLVTEMRAVKHYYTHGVQARLGIEY